MEFNPSYRHKRIESPEHFHSIYQESLRDRDQFWGEQAKRLHWDKPFEKVSSARLTPPVEVKWFEGGKLNASYNCLDRHLPERGSEVALIWEPNDPSEPAKKFTFSQLHAETMRFANVLKKLGVKTGDSVTLYMPMIPEAAIAMLACARLGAPHNLVFAGFSPEALAGRINNSQSKFVIAADEGLRGAKTTPLKVNVDKALESCPGVEKVLLVKRTGADVPFQEGRDHWYHDVASQVEDHCPPVSVDAEHPLFLLYTSGSTGQPKGVLHSTGGYLVHVGLSHEIVFDHSPGDIYWCTADVGWVTGHSFVVYAPLLNGGTTLMHEGLPTYPTPARHWEIIDKHQVNVFYTAPTAIRSLMSAGPEHLKSTHRKSLRILGSVGEPINPEAWKWFFEEVGHSRCPIVDTWWQTETGGIMISPVPGISPMKPGMATTPLWGVEPILMDDEGKVVEGKEASGKLCMKGSWPGQARTIFGDHKRFEETYYSAYPGYYFSGDGALRDKDGDYKITGRVDDVLNVSGHRLGTAEIESVLALHPGVAEAAVVGFPHQLKGEGVYCYVVLRENIQESAELPGELKKIVREKISPIATPDAIQFVPNLPKTRSGKIMRRILRKIAAGETGNVGDTSTLAEPEVVELIIQGRAAQS